MTWQGTTRTSTPEWRRLRLTILRRDRGRCYICRGVATEVDHILSHVECVRLGLDPDLPTNLAAICSTCHARKSSTEGNAEQARRRALRRRPAERHPGSCTPTA